jgi:predicted ribosomally synthesized peptide with nif11-like leader
MAATRKASKPAKKAAARATRPATSKPAARRPAKQAAGPPGKAKTTSRNVRAFLAAIEKDPALRARLRAPSEDARDRILAIAAEAGFQLTIPELCQAMEQRLATATSSSSTTTRAILEPMFPVLSERPGR